AEVGRAEPLFARYSGEFGPKTSSRCCGWRVRHLGWPVVVADTFRIERPGTLLDASFELPDPCSTTAWSPSSWMRPRQKSPSSSRVFPSAVTAQRYIGVVDRKSTRLNSSHDQMSYAVF